MLRVCTVDELPPGEARRVVADVPVAVFNVEGMFHAVDDTCTHQEASLAEGWVEDGCVECPLHASRFDLHTGEPTCWPAKRPVRVHPVVVTDGVVYLA